MTNGEAPSRSDPDVLIAGAGLAGLTALSAWPRPGSRSSAAAPLSGRGMDAPSPCSTKA